MPKRMSKKEYDTWRAEHHGRSQYQIFHKENGKDVADFVFWASCRKDALDELEIFRQKQMLVSPSSETEYFYREINNHVVVQNDGSYLVGTGILDIMAAEDEKETLLSKIKDFFSDIGRKAKDFRYTLRDIMFWFGHYDRRTSHGEEYGDCWSIDATVTRKILFNVPRMIRNLHGCPTSYTAKAVYETRTAKGARLTTEQAAKLQTTDEEMSKAMAMWKADLEKLLLYIRLYKYYCEYGVIGPEDGPEMAAIDREYRKTLPVMPGTDGEIDYVKCEELTQKYWELYCDHWKEIGRMCWD